MVNTIIRHCIRHHEQYRESIRFKKIPYVIEKIPYVIETLVEVWENSTLRGNQFNFSFAQTSTRVSITVWRHGKCFLFLKYHFNVETNYHNKLTVFHSEH